MTYVQEGVRCAEPDCEAVAVSRGRCRRHYSRWYRTERPDAKRESDRRWRASVDYNARRRKPKRAGTCPVCSTAFTTSSANKVYCGPRCKQIAYRKRK
jgi:hypothetical protein